MADRSSRLVVPYGAAATRALIATIAEAQAADPLAPVTVVVPSATAGVTLRRRLATRGLDPARRGVANVRFLTLPELADQLALPRLAADGRRRLSAVRAAAVAGSLLATESGRLGLAADQPSTAQALVATFAELDEVSERGLRRLAATEPRASDIVRLYRAFRRRVQPDASARDVNEAAVARVDAGDGSTELGRVAVHLPRRLRASETLLVEALARRGVLTEIVGDAAPLAGLAAATRVIRALDPAEEVDAAVRAVVEHLAAGVPAERIAIGSRGREPYLLLAHEALTAAGIAHWCPSPVTLAQSVVGRTLLGLGGLVDGGVRRADVMRWLRSAPMLYPATGRLVPAPWWDRLARRAGVSGGLDQWRMRLARAIARRAERPPREAEPSATRTETDPATEPEPSTPETATDTATAAEPEPDHVLESLTELAAFIDALAADLVPQPDASWRAMAAWASGLLARYLDHRAIASDASELAASDAVTSMLAELAGLDGVAPPPDPATFARHVAAQLDRPAASHGTLGRGVLVASLAQLAGADLDAVVVLGAAEGQLPPGRADDPLLPNRIRRAAGPGVPLRGLSPAEEHRDFLAALAAAAHRLVTVPRADPRSQRERHPARWVLDIVGERLHRPVTGADLDRLAGTTTLDGNGNGRGPVNGDGATGWFTDVASFEWWPATGRPAATPHDHDIGALLSAHRAGHDLRATAVARAVPSLNKGLTTVAARRAGAFNEWSGLVGVRPEFLSDLTRPQSPTALEHWVVCPFRYFLGHILRIDELDDPADGDTISALDRGSLVHDVLEAFVGEAIGRAPEAAWSPEERARLHELADEVAGGYEAAGRTGRPVLWELERQAMHRQLDLILDDDSLHRAVRRVSPLAVEHGFGFPDSAHPAVRVDLGGEREVVFRGRIDRIDRSPGGDRLVVLDYKTGDPTGFPDERTGDLTGGGRHLQLLVYAAAARAAYGDLPVEANYWFIGQRGELEMRGGPIDTAADQRFREVLDVVVDGVAGGRFPARPGAEDYFWGFEHCRWCPYDRICGTDRAEQWQLQRHHPELARYRRLVEPEESRS
ncbi:MAG: PD-(D/E)XK nuclease family protein [Acidimicrobiales bacterium]